MSDDQGRTDAADLLAFLDASPTPYHAAAEGARRLAAAGFQELDEREVWRIEPESRGFLRRGGSLLAFVAGTRAPADAGFLLLGAHTDSPNLRLKPSPDQDNHGYRQLGVEVYGGVLLHTWLDRDLGLAGRVTTDDGRTALVDLKDVTLRVPSLAIHLCRDVNTQGLVLNPQHHLLPVLGLSDGSAAGLLDLVRGQVPDVRAVLGFDLCLYDRQPAAFGGSADEFIFSGRLDNLASCHAALAALIRARPTPATHVVALYDHEEVGSQSPSGARSRLLLGALERLCQGLGGGDQALPRALGRSLFVSADMAHAVHPNYSDKHDRHHLPLIGGGPVIKTNANQSYTTDGPSTAFFRAACQAAQVPVQRFVSRGDMPCGSTVGPISAARLGMRGIDVGGPMLSMHSCREMAGSADVAPMIAALTAALEAPKLPDPAA